MPRNETPKSTLWRQHYCDRDEAGADDGVRVRSGRFRRRGCAATVIIRFRATSPENPAQGEDDEAIAVATIHLGVYFGCFDFARNAWRPARAFRISGSPCAQALSMVMRLKRHFWPSRRSSQS